MRIQINGEIREVSTAITLAALLEHLGMNGERVAIELNRNLVPRPEWASTRLAEQDRLEIVHFVGGGSLSPAPGGHAGPRWQELL
jgi:thiamine biosynthesis protein ThiS